MSCESERPAVHGAVEASGGAVSTTAACVCALLLWRGEEGTEAEYGERGALSSR